MSPLEIATGFVTGFVADAERDDTPAGDLSARAAFEAALLPALCRPPCVVSFSGGRDSSAVLAVATALARAEGLPLPVPVSQRFAGVASAEESAWQQHVIEALGVVDWEIIEVTDELDLVGPLAAAQVDRHGVLWPANTHFHALIAERARGGSLVTGFGGDEIMSPGWVWDRVNWVLQRRIRPGPKDLLAVAAAHGGPVLRRARARHYPDPTPPSPWLTPAANRAAAASRLAMACAEPVRHDEALRRSFLPSRYRHTVIQSLGMLGAGHEAQVVSPFVDARFVDALARERGRGGPRSRTSAMVQLFSDVLTTHMITRQGKATFNGAFWGPATAAFATGWAGEGLDPAVVDVDALAREWRRPDPDARTYSLVQHAWALTR